MGGRAATELLLDFITGARSMPPASASARRGCFWPSAPVSPHRCLTFETKLFGTSRSISRWALLCEAMLHYWCSRHGEKEGEADAGGGSLGSPRSPAVFPEHSSLPEAVPLPCGSVTSSSPGLLGSKRTGQSSQNQSPEAGPAHLSLHSLAACGCAFSCETVHSGR